MAFLCDAARRLRMFGELASNGPPLEIRDLFASDVEPSVDVDGFQNAGLSVAVARGPRQPPSLEPSVKGK